MSNIRLATQEDIPRLVLMGSNFTDSIEMGKHLGFDAEGFASYLSVFMSQPNCEVFVSLEGDEPVGMIGVVVNPHYANPATLYGSELFWWVEEEHRTSTTHGQNLFDVGLSWCKEQGASLYMMMSIESEKTDRLEKMYHRKGFKTVERLYFKEI